MSEQKLEVKIKLRIKAIAEEQGRSRTWLARHALVQYNTIQRLWSAEEQGELVDDVSLSVMIRIALSLRVPVSDLYEVIQEQ